MLDKNAIISILNDWNFWNKELETGIKRPDYLNRCSTLLATDQIVVITGPRRAGKSFIMRQMVVELMSKGVNKNDILMVNFEDPRFEGLDAATLQRIYDIYLEFLSPGSRPYVFLDEVQEVEGWERWVRTASELGKARIIISGSNAKLLSRELSTLLTGRHVDLTVFPLSFSEALLFSGINVATELDIADKKIDIMKVFNSFVEFGALPKVFLSGEKKEFLINYYDDIVNKDIIKRFRLRKPEQLKALARFYFSNVASPITFNSIEKFLNISADTAEKFSSYFEDAYLFFFVKRFSFKVKDQEKSPRKVYAVDTGLAKTVGFGMSRNAGQFAENVVFLELARRASKERPMEVFYWKDLQHKEVDFVVKIGAEVSELIQVCTDISNIATRRRETTALFKAMDQFEKKEGLILTSEYEAEESANGKVIKFIPLWKWLM